MFRDDFFFYLPTYTICLTSSASLAWGAFTQHPCVEQEGSWLPHPLESAVRPVPLGHCSFAGRYLAARSLGFRQEARGRDWI